MLSFSTIAGTFILRHVPEEAYSKADWKIDLDYKDIKVIYTLAVHPDYLKKGIGKKIMQLIINYSRTSKMKAIRLDVYETNAPAIKLYENCGFKYSDTIDLGYSQYGLDYFKLYQKIL